MISQDDHAAILKRLSATISFADGGCKELIWQPNLPRDVVRNLDTLARKDKTTRQDALRRTLLNAVGKEGHQTASEPLETARLSPEQAADFRNAVRDARVFEIPTKTFSAIIEACRVEAQRDLIATFEEFVDHTMGKKVIGTMRDLAHGRLVDRETEDYKQASTLVATAISRMNLSDLPEGELPFSSCFFMIPDPIPVEEGLARVISSRMGDLVGDEYRKVKIFGLLVSREICALHVGLEEENAFIDFRPLVMWHRTAWQFIAGGGFGYRVVGTFVRLVNEFKQVVEARGRSLSDQLLLKKLRKQGQISMAVPPPFYVVNLSDSFIRERRKQLFPSRPRQWNHRWDVRGHSMLKVVRGALGSLNDADRAVLARRGYKLFEASDPDPEFQVELARRRVPLRRADEWMAVLVRWKKSYIKGPQNKPYVPAAHRVPDRRTST